MDVWNFPKEFPSDLLLRGDLLCFICYNFTLTKIKFNDCDFKSDSVPPCSLRNKIFLEKTLLFIHKTIKGNKRRNYARHEIFCERKEEKVDRFLGLIKRKEYLLVPSFAHSSIDPQGESFFSSHLFTFWWKIWQNWTISDLSFYVWTLNIIPDNY